MNHSLEREHGHYNVFLITNNDFKTEAARIEYAFAVEGVRVKCMSVFDSERSENVQNYDYDIRMALAKALAESCDFTVVTGSRITKDIVSYVNMVVASGNKLYAPEITQKLIEKSIGQDDAKRITFQNSLMDCLE